MENKINIAELLRDCPKGMELDCTVFNGKVCFEGIDTNNPRYPIIISINLVNLERLDVYGQYNTRDYANCVIFPKGKTTWEGFVPPKPEFKCGDVLACDCSNGDSQLFIFKEYDNDNNTVCFLFLDTDGTLDIDEFAWRTDRLATEEEKQKLFDAIKDNGYRWNAETKTLEELVEPKFKVGDRIQSKDFIEERTIKICEEDGYWTTVDTWIRISDQDDWELIPNKFDIATLKPFDKVLCRHNKDNKWKATLFSHLDEDFHSHCYKFVTVSGSYPYMIPYESNHHLLGTTNDCDDFYKTWKK